MSVAMRLIDARYANPHIKVFLDGVDVSSVTTVACVPHQSDVEGKGWVDMVQLSENGAVLPDETGIDPLIKRIEGRVRWEME